MTQCFNDSMPLTYSFVIPAYNESSRIRPTLDALLRFVQEQNWDAEILVVNDGSTDDTAQIAQDYGKRHSQIVLVETPAIAAKATACATECSMPAAISASSLTPIFFRPSPSRSNFSTPSPAAPISPSDRAGLKPNCRPNVSPFIARPLGASQSAAPRRSRPPLRRHAMRIQSLSPHRRATHLPSTKNRTLGLRSRDPVSGKTCRPARRRSSVLWAHSEGTRLHPFRDGMRMFLEVLRIRWNAITREYTAVAVPTPEKL